MNIPIASESADGVEETPVSSCSEHEQLQGGRAAMQKPAESDGSQRKVPSQDVGLAAVCMLFPRLLPFARKYNHDISLYLDLNSGCLTRDAHVQRCMIWVLHELPQLLVRVSVTPGHAAAAQVAYPIWDTSLVTDLTNSKMEQLPGKQAASEVLP